MAKLGINTGTAANAGDGDTLRAGGSKINANFDEIYTYFGDGSNLTFVGDEWATVTTGINTLSNVGIGTTSPTDALTVRGNVSITGACTATTFHGSGEHLTDLPTDSLWSQTSVGISTLVRVGVGTTNPLTKFVVFDNSTETNVANSFTPGISLYNNAATDGNYTGIRFVNAAGNDIARVLGVTDDADGNGGNIVFVTDNSSGALSERARITGFGSFGVNNDDPNYTVDVTGTVGANDVNVSGAVTISGTTQSSSSTTGALVVTGGVGIGKSITCGSNNMFIYHDGSHGNIYNNTGDLKIRDTSALKLLSNSVRLKNADDDETYLAADDDGSLELYYDNSLKFETTTSGWQSLNNVKGVFGTGIGTTAMELYHDGTDGWIGITTTDGELKLSTAQLTVKNVARNQTLAQFTAGESVDLYFNNSKKLETTNTGVAVVSTAGTSKQVDIYHDATDGYVAISTSTGELKLTANQITLKDFAKNTTLAQFTVNESSDLYFNNSKKLETTNSGVAVVSTAGTSKQVEIYHDTTDGYVALSTTTGELKLKAGQVSIRNFNGNEVIGSFNQDSGVDLYYDNTKKFETISEGVMVTGIASVTSNITCTNAYISGECDVTGQLDVFNTSDSTSVTTGSGTFAGGVGIKSTVNIGWSCYIGGECDVVGQFEVQNTAQSTSENNGSFTCAGGAGIKKNLHVGGSLSKGSGSFRIPHPIVENKDLVHSFVEGPKADLIYRGKITLVGGTASVDMDAEVGLTPGTWNALTRDPQVFVQNNAGWTAVKGSVSGSILTIVAQYDSCIDEIDWLIIADRQDDSIKSADWTDSEGRPILEPDSV